MVSPSAGCGFDGPPLTCPEFWEALMSIRLLLVGSLGLSLFAAPKAPAGENDSCPAQKCDCEKGGTCPQKQTDKERKIESKLHTKVTLNFTDAPLKQIIDDLRGWENINIYVDQLTLDQEGVSLERPVSVKLENVSLKSALNLILRQVHLTYIIKDEVLQITSESATRGRMQRVTYQVGDLIIPIPNSFGNASIRESNATQTREEQLIKLITKTVEPRSWSDQGGVGTIDYHPLTKSLVINQTPDVQEQVLDMLNSLRRLQNEQVALEVRFISVDETVADRVRSEFQDKEEIKLVAPSDAPLRLAFLDAAERSRLLEVVEGDRRTSVMQPPNPTVFSGQSWNWETGEKKTFVTGVDCRLMANGSQIFQPITEDIAVGTRLTARPVISADRRIVNVDLDVHMNKLDDPEADMIPITLPHGPEKDGEQCPATQLAQRPRISHFGLNNTLAIPDGVTALISGWKREHGVRTESRVPMLSDIPYLGRLFTNMAYTREKECVLILVTPHIFVAEEQEEKKPTE
jgi:type II secretory pathway component GspD/PulD (secretin)